MNFKAYCIFIFFWSLLVYPPLAKWVWGGGFFDKLPTGATLDFAGGTVVHINAAVTALVLCRIIGKRNDVGRLAIIPHNVPFTLLGAGILWFGWFGFNGGSAYEANNIAALACANTLLAPAITLLVWAFLDIIFTGHITAIGLATSIIVGLVAITPAAGLVSPLSAMLIGLIATFPSYFLIMWRAKTDIDDSLDVFGAHGLGGIVGAILTGVFASQAWGADVNGSLNQVVSQIVSVLITCVFSALMTFLIANFIALFMKLRVSKKEESIGLDTSLHGEEAYNEGEGALLISVNESFVAKNLIENSSLNKKEGVLKS